LGEVGRRGKSLLKVRQKLYHKWIPKSHVATVIEDHEDELQDWMSVQIEKLAHRFSAKWASYLETLQKLLARWYTAKDVQRSEIEKLFE
jgi:SOS response regulatory protein OraA/RecX